MKQIIVNVSGLSEEEKQRVNEALAKITGVHKLPVINPKAEWFFVPTSGAKMVTWGMRYQIVEPTHTPQQVLEMAGMVEKRKVRKDFDPTKEYSVNVEGCTEVDKKEVQQAFFDVGMPWEFYGENYVFLLAPQYSNTTGEGQITSHCMHSSEIESCNMTAEEFLELVYEPEIKGHVHADLMALYAEDAKTTDKPWELWQIKNISGEWRDLTCNPSFATHLGYRRKPKTHTVNGVEVPDLRIDAKEGEYYYLPDPTEPEFTYKYEATIDICDTVWTSRRLCYEPTEAGKQAAILHAKAWLGIA